MLRDRIILNKLYLMILNNKYKNNYNKIINIMLMRMHNSHNLKIIQIISRSLNKHKIIKLIYKIKLLININSNKKIVKLNHKTISRMIIINMRNCHCMEREKLIQIMIKLYIVTKCIRTD